MDSIGITYNSKNDTLIEYIIDRPGQNAIKRVSGGGVETIVLRI